jgi:hypothetical protein
MDCAALMQSALFILFALAVSVSATHLAFTTSPIGLEGIQARPAALADLSNSRHNDLLAVSGAQVRAYPVQASSASAIAYDSHSHAAFDIDVDVAAAVLDVAVSDLNHNGVPDALVMYDLAADAGPTVGLRIYPGLASGGFSATYCELEASYDEVLLMDASGTLIPSIFGLPASLLGQPGFWLPTPSASAPCGVSFSVSNALLTDGGPTDVFASPFSALAADFDGDCVPELALVVETACRPFDPDSPRLAPRPWETCYSVELWRRDDPSDASARYERFTTAYIGPATDLTQLTVADFDGDGVMDLAVGICRAVEEPAAGAVSADCSHESGILLLFSSQVPLCSSSPFSWFSTDPVPFCRKPTGLCLRDPAFTIGADASARVWIDMATVLSAATLQTSGGVYAPSLSSSVLPPGVSVSGHATLQPQSARTATLAPHMPGRLAAGDFLLEGRPSLLVPVRLFLHVDGADGGTNAVADAVVLFRSAMCTADASQAAATSNTSAAFAAPVARCVSDVVPPPEAHASSDSLLARYARSSFLPALGAEMGDLAALPFNFSPGSGSFAAVTSAAWLSPGDTGVFSILAIISLPPAEIGGTPSWNPVFLSNAAFEAGFFSAATALGDLCHDAPCPASTSVGAYGTTASFGVALPGATFKISTSSLSGAPQLAVATQLPASAFAPLAPAVALWGIGRVAGYIDNLHLGLANGISYSWAGILPSSHVFVLPVPPTSPMRWAIKVYLPFPDAVPAVALAAAAVLLALLIAISFLQLKEISEDRRESEIMSKLFAGGNV